MNITLRSHNHRELKEAIAAEVSAQEPLVLVRAHVRKLGPTSFEADLTFVQGDEP